MNNETNTIKQKIISMLLICIIIWIVLNAIVIFSGLIPDKFNFLFMGISAIILILFLNIFSSKLRFNSLSKTKKFLSNMPRTETDIKQLKENPTITPEELERIKNAPKKTILIIIIGLPIMIILYLLAVIKTNQHLSGLVLLSCIAIIVLLMVWECMSFLLFMHKIKQRLLNIAQNEKIKNESSNR
ncbi:MAG: hypothetical protein II183_01465 [Elusimicrobiaceae bacterium]|nr:hypothetical protein [Elusimicrobiaceae bacterium]